MCLQGFRSEVSVGLLDLILCLQYCQREKKKNHDSSIQFSSLPKAIYVEMETSGLQNNTLYTIHNAVER